MEPIRVLVTGAGSGVGQGIIKALNISNLSVEIISADISPYNAALYRTDNSVIIPKVEEKKSLEKIIHLININRIHVVLIGSEFDLSFFSENKDTIETQTNAVVIASPVDTVKKADDKWLTAEFLRKNNLPYPESYLPKNTQDAIDVANCWGYPVLIKPRSGTSNRHVHILYTPEEINHIFQQISAPVLQKIIHMPDVKLKNEFTCSIFKTRNGKILGPFTARRTLKGGASWIVEVDCFKELYPILSTIGEKMDILGSMNIQLMLDDKNVAVPFEFNARFSGTTAIRAHFGFNEPEMSIRNYYLNENIDQPVKIGKGIVFRYLEEVFIDNATYFDLNSSSKIKGHVASWF